MDGTRRELLYTFLGASMAGCAKNYARAPSTREHPFEGQFVDPFFRCGHQLREPSFVHKQTEASSLRRAEVLVLGAGVAGLAASWKLMRLGIRDLVVLDLEAHPGGTAVGVEGDGLGYPWGAHYLPAPQPDQPELVHFLEVAGCIEGYRLDGTPQYREEMKCVAPQERVFCGGVWQPGLVPSLGVSKVSIEAVKRFHDRVAGYAGLKGEDGRRVFCLPIVNASEDPKYQSLDKYTFAEWLERERLSDPLVRWLANYATRDDYGARLEETSAWYGLHYYASRLSHSRQLKAPLLTWPEGNAFLVRHLAKGLRYGKEREGSERPQFLGHRLVTGIWPHGPDGGAHVEVLTERGQEIWSAQHVICALPSFLRSRLLKGSQQVFSVDTSAWMVANIHLDRRPGYRGVETAWDNVLYHSASLGYVVSTHQRGPYAGPSTWTWYLPLVGSNVKALRRYLMSLTWAESVELVMSDLEVAHPNIRQCVRRIDIRRWGHAMPIPRPGVLTSLKRSQAARPIGRVHFAHTDLSGVGLFEEAFAHGVRAAQEAWTTRQGSSPMELRW